MQNKQHEFFKQQEKLKSITKIASKNIDPDFMIEKLISDKETFKFAEPEPFYPLPKWLNLKNGLVPKVYEQVWQAVKTPTKPPACNTEKVTQLFTTSGLPLEELGYLWSLANVTSPGVLTQQELYVMLALIALLQAGYQIRTINDLKDINHPILPQLDYTFLNVTVANPAINRSCKPITLPHMASTPPFAVLPRLNIRDTVSVGFGGQPNSSKVDTIELCLDLTGNDKKNAVFETDSVKLDQDVEAHTKDDDFSNFQSAIDTIVEFDHAVRYKNAVQEGTLASIYSKNETQYGLEHLIKIGNSDHAQSEGLVDFKSVTTTTSLFEVPIGTINNNEASNFKTTESYENKMLPNTYENEQFANFDNEFLPKKFESLAVLDEKSGNYSLQNSKNGKKVELVKTDICSFNLHNAGGVRNNIFENPMSSFESDAFGDGFEANFNNKDTSNSLSIKRENLMHGQISEPKSLDLPQFDADVEDEFADFQSAFVTSDLKNEFTDFQSASSEKNESSVSLQSEVLAPVSPQRNEDKGKSYLYGDRYEVFRSLIDDSKGAKKNKDDFVDDESDDTASKEDEFGDFVAANLKSNNKNLTLKEKCVQSCRQLLNEGLSIFSSIKDEEILAEVLSNPKGYRYFHQLKIIYETSQRFKEYSHISNEIQSLWSQLCTFRKYIPEDDLFDEVVCEEDMVDVSPCGICDTECDVNFVRYGGKYYHVTCINLFLHFVKDAELSEMLNFS